MQGASPWFPCCASRDGREWIRSGWNRGIIATSQPNIRQSSRPGHAHLPSLVVFPWCWYLKCCLIKNRVTWSLSREISVGCVELSHTGDGRTFLAHEEREGWGVGGAKHNTHTHIHMQLVVRAIYIIKYNYMCDGYCYIHWKRTNQPWLFLHALTRLESKGVD